MEFTVNDQSVYVCDGGVAHQPEQPTLVFIHGAPLDHTFWSLNSRYFARNGWNVMAVDLPGHGKSSGAALASVEAMADWLAALLRVAGVEKAHVAGHSLGSLVTLDFCGRYPEMAARGVLLGTAFPMAVGQPLLDAAKANDHAAIDMVALFGHSMASQLGANPVAGMSVYNMAVRLMERAAPDVMYTDLNACNSYASGLDAAQQVQCPMRLIIAKYDLMTPPRATKELMAVLPDAQSTIIENSGHMMVSEAPEATHQALLWALR